MASHSLLVGETPSPIRGGALPRYPHKGASSKMIKRTRSIPFSFRLTPDEAELLNQKLAASGQSKTDFLMQSLLQTDVIVINDLSACLAELKRQGSNLNQAMRFAHEFGRTEELVTAIQQNRNCIQTLQLLARETRKKVFEKRRTK